LGDEGVSLGGRGEMLAMYTLTWKLDLNPKQWDSGWMVFTFSRISCSCDSVLNSSSEGLVGMLAAEAYCEYVWKSDSVCCPGLDSCADNSVGHSGGVPGFLMSALVGATVPSLRRSMTSQRLWDWGKGGLVRRW
jgi:hypothetical protein